MDGIAYPRKYCFSNVNYLPNVELQNFSDALKRIYATVIYLRLVSKSGLIKTSVVTSKAKVVGNKAKGRISKRMFQENKASQIFQKTNISYSLIPEMFVFLKIRRALFS